MEEKCLAGSSAGKCKCWPPSSEEATRQGQGHDVLLRPPAEGRVLLGEGRRGRGGKQMLVLCAVTLTGIPQREAEKHRWQQSDSAHSSKIYTLR